MKRFPIYALSVLLPVATFLSIGEHIARQMPDATKYKAEWMEAHHNEVETLVFGTSHTFNGIRPEYLDGLAFNLANSGQWLKYDYFLFNRYDCPRLEKVIVDVSYPTLFKGGYDEGEDKNDWRQFIFDKYYKGDSAVSLFSPYNYEFINLYPFRTKLTKYVKDAQSVDWDEWGWDKTCVLTKSSSRRLSIKKTTESVDKHTTQDWNVALSRAERNLTMLKDMAKVCNERGIRLILITTPCWHIYYERLNQRQYDKMHELIRLVQEQYGVPYFDYMKDSRFEEDDFYDSHHLSVPGAEKFTKILNEDIRNYSAYPRFGNAWKSGGGEGWR